MVYFQDLLKQWINKNTTKQHKLMYSRLCLAYVQFCMTVCGKINLLNFKLSGFLLDDVKTRNNVATEHLKNEADKK